MITTIPRYRIELGQSPFDGDTEVMCVIDTRTDKVIVSYRATTATETRQAMNEAMDMARALNRRVRHHKEARAYMRASFPVVDDAFDFTLNGEISI